MGVNYDILESDFNKKLSSAYQLSIQVGMDSLVYFVFDANSATALKLRSIPYVNRPGENFDLSQEIRNIFSKEELFTYLFRRVRISLPVGASVLVPSRLYNENEKETYLRELTTEYEQPKAAIRHDEVPEVGAHIVYYIDPEYIKAIKKQFPTAHVINPATPLILGARHMTESSAGHSMFVHFTKKELHLSLFEKRNLVFYNSFPYAAASDVLYYTLLVIEQFGLDPAKVPLSLSGQILEDAEIYRTLSRYLGKMKFMPEPSFLKFGRRFAEVLPYFFFDLYSLALCK